MREGCVAPLDNDMFGLITARWRLLLESMQQKSGSDGVADEDGAQHFQGAARSLLEALELCEQTPKVTRTANEISLKLANFQDDYVASRFVTLASAFEKDPRNNMEEMQKMLLNNKDSGSWTPNMMKASEAVLASLLENVLVVHGEGGEGDTAGAADGADAHVIRKLCDIYENIRKAHPGPYEASVLTNRCRPMDKRLKAFSVLFDTQGEVMELEGVDPQTTRGKVHNYMSGILAMMRTFCTATALPLHLQGCCRLEDVLPFLSPSCPSVSIRNLVASHLVVLVQVPSEVQKLCCCLSTASCHAI